MENTPKLSDLIRDWAEAGNWPVTITASKDYKPLCWVETAQKLQVSEDPLAVSPCYIGTIHDDEAYFASSKADMQACHPDFFGFLADAIVTLFEEVPILDKSKLPYGGDRARIFASDAL